MVVAAPCLILSVASLLSPLLSLWFAREGDLILHPKIGVVRAVGGSLSQVRRTVLAEALLLGLFGAATGVVAGVAMSYGFISAFSSIAWQIPYEFPAFGILAAVLLGVLLALFASILPARSAAKLDIIKALQYE